MDANTHIRGKFILESINNGLSFEEALEKSFNQVNEFLNNLSSSEMFKEITFQEVKSKL